MAEQADDGICCDRAPQPRRRRLTSKQSRAGDLDIELAVEREYLPKAPLKVIGLRRLGTVDADLQRASCACLHRDRARCHRGRVRGQTLDAAYLVADTD